MESTKFPSDWLPISSVVEDDLVWAVVPFPKAQLKPLLPENVEFGVIPQIYSKYIPSDHHLVWFEFANHQNSYATKTPIFKLSFRAFKFQIPWVKHATFGGPLNFKPLEYQDNFLSDIGTEIQFRVNTKHCSVDYNIAKGYFNVLKCCVCCLAGHINTTFPNPSEWTTPDQVPNFQLYKDLNSMPFFDRNLDHCGVDYHKWNEATIRAVAVRIEASAHMIPTVNKDSTFDTKDILSHALGAVELKGQLFVSDPTPVQDALKHPAK